MTLITGYARKQEPKWLQTGAVVLVVLAVLAAIFIFMFVVQWLGKLGEVGVQTVRKVSIQLKNKAPASVPKKESSPVANPAPAAPSVSATAPVSENKGGYVEKIVFSSDINGSNLPADELSSFSLGKYNSVYCYTRINSPSVPDMIHHVWIAPDGREIADIQLNVSHVPADTWSYVSLAGTRPGNWQLLVKKENGEVVGKGTFVVTD